MIINFSKPIIEITEVERTKCKTKEKTKKHFTGIIVAQKKCHACGMNNVTSLRIHDLMNPFCPWTIYRSRPIISNKITKNSIIHFKCTIHLCTNKIIENAFVMFHCKHVVCIPCAMSLVPYKCPYNCEIQSNNKLKTHSYLIKYTCS